MDDIYHAKEVVGEMGSDIYMYDVNNYKISIQHDVAYKHDDYDNKEFNMVCTGALNSTVKRKVNTYLPFQPLIVELVAQRVNKFIAKEFPELPQFNYGIIPQTWNSEKKVHSDCGLKGSNDALNVIDLTDRPKHLYGVYKVKMIGGFQTNDMERRDWKVLAIENSEENSAINSTEDYEKLFPGKLDKIVEFIRTYKIKKGITKKGKTIITSYKDVDQNMALELIENSHSDWKNSRPLALQSYVPKQMTFNDGTSAVYLFDKFGNKISWRNDINLTSDSYESDEITMILEVSQASLEKMEVTENLEFNPIIQKRIKKSVDDVDLAEQFYTFPLFNYGSAPQTFTDQYKGFNSQVYNKADEENCELVGSGTTLDVVEQSGNALAEFDCYKVKVLGALCLIDGNQLDWKLMTIETNSDLCERINNLDEYIKEFPDHFNAVKDFFKVYKVKSQKRKTENHYLEERTILNKEDALHLIKNCNFCWQSRRPLSIMKMNPREYKLPDGKSAVYLFDDKDRKCSFWNDIELKLPGYNKDEYNMVMEISSTTRAKMEISRDMEFNPIICDTEINKITGGLQDRDYALLPIFNYGALPQTWEDPNRKATDGDWYGDQDPIDVVEIGGYPLSRFEVYKVRILGALKMIDDGEVDWKLLAIEVNQPLNKEVKDIADLRKRYPKRYTDIVNWFKNYKIAAGKTTEQNIFAREDEDILVDETIEIIEETYQDWVKKRPLAAIQYYQKEITTKDGKFIYLFDKDDNTISWWNDVPLQLKGYEHNEFNMIMEISSVTQAKMEISRTHEFNPIVVDKEDNPNKPGEKRDRNYAIQPIFNYGALPQTWEDPNRTTPDGKFRGDCDPLDVVEISGKPLTRFDVYKVKILGCLKLIDSGEVDWKLLAIESTSPMYKELNTIEEFRDRYTQKYEDIKTWFRTYKVKAGKKRGNFFLREDEDISVKETIEIINETHEDFLKKRPLAVQKLTAKAKHTEEGNHIYLYNEKGEPCSWWDDVPRKGPGYAEDEFNMILEISQYKRAKMEISRDIDSNPIVQDKIESNTKPGKIVPREYAIDPIFNYGAIPQTWEDPARKAEEGEYYGDKDPIDVVEISGFPLLRYEVYKIRVIGVLKVIDANEVDWKVIAIDVNSDLNKKVKTWDDWLRECPGQLQAIKDWFITYKTFVGGAPNIIVRDDEVISLKETLEIIQETAEDWERKTSQEKK